MKRKQEGSLTAFEKIKSKISWSFYSLSIAVGSKIKRKNKKHAVPERKRLKDGIFVYLMLLWPILQFCVFYIAVNANSIIMTFQRYNGEKFVFAGGHNFRLIWQDFVSKPVFGRVLTNSLLSFALIQLMSPIVLFFTFFIYKKFVGYKFFKIVLFLPTIISSVITANVFMMFCEKAIPKIWETLFNIQIPGLLTDPKTKFGAVMFFYMWLSFGTLMLMYLGCMNGISESIVESAKLEGANNLQEFFYITFPMIYPTFSTLFYTSIAGIFTNQINLYSFWGGGADSSVQTFGYYMYKEVLVAGNGQYPYLAALGISMTVIAAPLTFFFKWLLNKIGPSAE